MNYERVLQLLADLSLMRFFPSGEGALIGIARMVGNMAENEDQVKWLVQRVLDLHNDWPGLLEIRAIFCSRYRPKDGKTAYSAVYPGGIPPEKQAPLALPAAPPPELEPPQGEIPEGHVASADPEADEMIKALAEHTEISAPRPTPARPRGIPSPTEPPREPLATVPVNQDFKPITQADIDRAVEELRNRRALAELKGESNATEN